MVATLEELGDVDVEEMLGDVDDDVLVGLVVLDDVELLNAPEVLVLLEGYVELVLGDVAELVVSVWDEVAVLGDVELIELELLLGVVDESDWSVVAAELVFVFVLVLTLMSVEVAPEVVVPTVELV